MKMMLYLGKSSNLSHPELENAKENHTFSICLLYPVTTDTNV